MITLNIIIIAITCLVSYLAFSNETLMDKLIFYPPSITRDNQWYRFITSGFIHADMMHLGFNMLTLYFFGRNLEYIYSSYFGVSQLWYLILYISALIVSQIPSFLKNKNNYYYKSLGASGAVSAIVFSMILLMPWSTLYVFIIPVPAIIYAIFYLGYSVYMNRKAGDSINNDARTWGAVHGIIFKIALLTEVLNIFFQEISHPNIHLNASYFNWSKG